MRQVVRNFVSQPSALGSDQPNDDLAAELQSYAICRLLAPFATVGAVQRYVRSWMNNGSGWITLEALNLTYSTTAKC